MNILYALSDVQALRPSHYDNETIAVVSIISLVVFADGSSGITKRYPTK